MSLDRHLFSIYVPNFFDDTCKVGIEKKVEDFDLVHRLNKVLRIQVGQQFIFFDRTYHALVQIVTISKKQLAIGLIRFEKNIRPLSEIKFLLPLLKKEALEEAVYSLTEIGVSEIQLVITQKSRQRLLHEKEFSRLESIVIAAAEQSKNYIFPTIYPPIHLFDLDLESDLFKIVFEAQGESFFNLRSILKTEKVCLLVGPEAGLMQEELQNLESYMFKKCRLTPTTLRAVQAVAVGAGLFKIT